MRTVRRGGDLRLLLTGAIATLVVGLGVALSHDARLERTQSEAVRGAEPQAITQRCGCMPPDTQGAVGPNHYMQWVNLHYAIWTKTGTQVVPPTTGNTLFTGLTHCGATNSGDIVMLYDQAADRWLASQFSF